MIGAIILSTRRNIRKVMVGATAVAAAAILSLNSGSAFAAAAPSTTVTRAHWNFDAAVGFTDSGEAIGQAAGDCQIVSETLTYDVFSHILRWRGVMKTSHTNNADIWHAKF